MPFVSVTAVAMLLPLGAAGTVEPLSTAELAEHCAHYEEEPKGEGAKFCVRYVQGFIDGAMETDERATEIVAAELERNETHAESYARIRYGRRSTHYDATDYAQFCLGESVTLTEVVERVVRALREHAIVAKPLHARTVVYRMLRDEYPCEAQGAQ